MTTFLMMTIMKPYRGLRTKAFTNFSPVLLTVRQLESQRVNLSLRLKIVEMAKPYSLRKETIGSSFAARLAG